MNDELGGGVTRGTTRSCHEIGGGIVEAVGESEIGDDHVAVSIEEEILEFEITVNDSFPVKVRDSRDELSEESRGVALLQVSVSEDMVKEFSA